jgi:AsmA protein
VRFEQPSVNLVRNADGHWNLEAVLVHASRVDTAPTAQQKAGAAPRFPYIEATGGRINLKLGAEKMPFSLTDADFALWLPSPQTWRVRLEGKPMRTDSNIGDPGTVRVEGVLQRAARMEDVPVDLHASWYDAPLGEASRLISGDDRGWRGTLHAEASLQGPLSSAALQTRVTLDDLRRTDFVPAQPLDETVRCAAKANVPATLLSDLTCAMPVGGTQPIALAAAQLDLAHPEAAQATVTAAKLPLDWVFGWLRLFSPRIPQDPRVPGSVDAELTHAPATPLRSWSGTATVTMPGRHAAGSARSNVSAGEPAQQFPLTVTADGSAWTAQMPPTTVRLGAASDVTVSGQASPSGYSFAVNGTASTAQLTPIVHAFPQLGDDTGLLNTKTGAAPDAVRAIALSCTRVLSGGQVCTSPAPVAPRAPRRSGHTRRR